MWIPNYEIIALIFTLYLSSTLKYKALMSYFTLFIALPLALYLGNYGKKNTWLLQFLSLRWHKKHKWNWLITQRPKVPSLLSEQKSLDTFWTEKAKIVFLYENCDKNQTSPPFRSRKWRESYILQTIHLAQWHISVMPAVGKRLGRRTAGVQEFKTRLGNIARPWFKNNNKNSHYKNSSNQKI